MSATAAAVDWFGVEAAGLFERPRAFDGAPELDPLLSWGVVVEDGVVVVEVVVAVVTSFKISLEGVDALESLSLPLELAPSDFLAFGVAPRGIELAKKENYQFRRIGSRFTLWT